ncbi:MAG: aspartate--tRNA ligase [Pseudomonadota bacterium]
MHAYRTHDCGALRKSDVGQTVRLSGWVHRRYDLGGVVFVNLRDHYGVTQVFADPDSPVFAQLEGVRSEWCVRIDGEVKARSDDTVNASLSTGEIEVFVRDLEVLGEAGELPLPVYGEPDYPEDTRLRYRFLDLRRETLHANIVKRAHVITSMRKRMEAAGFLEFQTPILTASSPEGARDFLVPSRLHPGKFYALPQAPQQFKQLAMIAGFDRYFQIAPCFRDEDPRADRSPGEFYQLDLEMSFVTQDDVFAVMEPVLRDLFVEFSSPDRVSETFRRIPYEEAMLKYGTDKPDLRNPIEMRVVSDHFRGSGFKIFAQMLETNEKAEIRAIPAPTGGSRAFCDRMNSWAQKEGQPGLGYIFFRHETLPQEAYSDMEHPLRKIADAQQLQPIVDVMEARAAATGKGGVMYSRLDPNHYVAGSGPLAKNIGPERTEALRIELGLAAGDAVFFCAGEPSSFVDFAGKARTAIAEELELVAKDRFEFAWIVDFPIYEWDDELKKWEFEHNPFSMPQGGLEALENKDPSEIKGYQYDLVCNGYELASGAIRNHKPEIMYKAFGIAGFSQDEVDANFGGMISAFKFGAPPHGGMAAGVERIVMLLAGQAAIREVMMFPMNQRAEDPMMGAPSEVSPEQLKELGLKMLTMMKG